MALYIKFTSGGPKTEGVPVGYPYIAVQVEAYTTADFQGGTQVSSWTVTAASFNTNVPLTGNPYTFAGDVPDGIYQSLHTIKHAIDGPMPEATEYHHQATITGYSITHGSSDPTVSDVYNFTTEGDPPAPTKATNPTPANSATDVDFSGLQLSWDDGGGADTFDVYIGETGDLTLVSSAQAGTTYTTTLAELETIFEASPIDQKIYWRIDSINESGTTEGDEWNFDSRPTKAENPTPANSATDVDFSGLQLSWDDGGGADTFDVYIGETGSLTLVSSIQAGTTYTTTIAELETIFGTDEETGKIEQKIYWRIDSINESGTTEGDEWNFDPRPTKSGNHSPVDEFGDMTLDWQEFTWDAVDNADSYNAYMGTDIDLEAEDLEQILDTSPRTSMTQAYMAVATKLVYPNTGEAVYNYTYHWRVDTVNDFGITEGDVLEFGTIVYNPPLPWGMSMPSGGDDNQTPTGTPLGLNNMITIRKLVAAAGNKFWYESI